MQALRPSRLLAALVFAACVFFSRNAGSASAAPLLIRDPAISASQLAFVYGGDIWIADRDGANARRLVTGLDRLARPIFSPDGTKVAFTGVYDKIDNVYVVDASGGDPKRLTFDSSGDTAVGWTPDGKDVLFNSARESTNDPNLLFTISVDGGPPRRLPLPMAEDGSYSPDGTHLAYVPGFRWEPYWQKYRGGQTSYVLVANLADSSVVKIPRDNSNDEHPMWIGKTVYFLSDRDGPTTLFAYDTATKAVTRELPAQGFDITSASAGPGAIVYSQFDSLHVFDLATHQSRELHVAPQGDFPQLRPHYEKVGDQIQNADLSPTGVRAVFEAHGDIFTVPAEHGDVRNITSTPAVEERDPAWSPDGRSIAYFSDASGDYRLYVRDQRGLLPPRAIDLGEKAFFYSPRWSPDSKKIAYYDKHLNLWYVDLGRPSPAPVKIATAPFETFGANDFEASWSPDSRQLAYALQLHNYLHAIDVYSLEENRSRQLTDGMSDAQFPLFDPSGRYLYFASSTNVGLTSGGLDMVSDQHPVTYAIYAAVLRRDDPSPDFLLTDDEAAKSAAPGSSDEPDGTQSPAPMPSATAAADKASAEKAAAAAKAAQNVRIDYDGVLQRIVALPIPQANYAGLAIGKTGVLYADARPETTVAPVSPPGTIYAYDPRTRKVTPFASGVSAFVLSFDGSKALLARGNQWAIVATAKPASPGDGAIDTAAMETYVVPREMWKQMYRETWRIERDFFYDPHDHGLDIAAAERRFEPYLDGISSRDELTYLFEEMLSYLAVGHMFVRGGEQPPMQTVNVGHVGADFAVENGKYRFSKIYDGENWNPGLRAPLTQPGANVHVGDYLLAVNGKPVEADRDVYAYFQETANVQTTLRVGPNANGEGARDVTVVPLPSDFGLRNLDWIESNRRKVDAMSGGKLAYVYLPDTEYGGFTNFNRYFFAQVGKEGAILDERFNHGGQIADYIIDYLNRKPMSILEGRDGETSIDPPLAIYGPKVMIINQFAGSGGDAMPWYFRKSNIGTLVGERTWGGLVGIGGYPPLMDGGSVTAPRVAIGGLHGQWEVENHGIPPDVEVFQDPKLTREGHDPQLEAAVEIALKQLREHPVPKFAPPPYTDHHPVLPAP